MARPLLLSNGSLHIGLNRFGLVHDFYYPYVGLENHTAARGLRHKVGVWVDGQFSWLDDESWDIKMNYEHEAMIGLVTARNERLQITLEFHDCVDSELDVFLRSIHVINMAGVQRDVRVFMHQVFLISNSLNGDTAQYLPAESAILHYKGHRAFITGARDHNGEPFDQHAIGVFGIEGKQGTYKDAEDGELSGNQVEHGEVDSVIRCKASIEAHGSTRIQYWIACGKTLEAAKVLHRAIQADGIEARQSVTEQSWRHWLARSEKVREQIPAEYSQRFIQSMFLSKAHLDKHGAVIASTDTTMLNYARDAYGYCWPRDAVNVLWPLLRMGYVDETQRFFEFCKRGITKDGYMMHKYMADGSVGSSWHPYIFAGKPEPPIQEDETACVVFLMGQYFHQTSDRVVVAQYYEDLIKPMANFLATYVDEKTGLPHASYDLWEEKFLTSTYTVGMVYGALNTAVELAELMTDKASAVAWQSAATDIRDAAHKHLFNKEKQFFFKGVRHEGDDSLYEDDVIDLSSFYGAFMFGLFSLDSDEVTASYETLKNRFDFTDLKFAPLPRYEHDRYNTVSNESLGNPWFVTTLWLADYYLETGREDQARMILDWTCSKMLDSGVLPEQISPYDDTFVGVAPLAWSQAEFLNTVLDIVSRPHGEAK